MWRFRFVFDGKDAEPFLQEAVLSKIPRIGDAYPAPVAGRGTVRFVVNQVMWDFERGDGFQVRLVTPETKES